MSVITTTDAKTDPKFCPPAAALKIVGLAVADIKTDDAIFALFKNNVEAAEHAENQNSVAVYILIQRGWKYEDLVSKLGQSESTLKRKMVEGMAILRTGEVTRTTAAVRQGSLSKQAVDDLTKGVTDKGMKIVALEQAALETAIKSRYTNDKGEPVDMSKIKTDVLHSRLAQTVENDAVPVTAATLIQYIPTLTEELGLKVKQRSTEPDGGTGPQGMEFHLKACLKDIEAIETANDGLKYEPTAQDLAALLRLMQHLDIAHMIEDMQAEAFAEVSA